VPSTPELVLWLQAICHCDVLVELLNPTVPEQLLSKHGEEQSSSKAQGDTLLPVTSDAISAEYRQTTFEYGGLAQRLPAGHFKNV
jgi:hypothetical protein